MPKFHSKPTPNNQMVRIWETCPNSFSDETSLRRNRSCMLPRYLSSWSLDVFSLFNILTGSFLVNPYFFRAVSWSYTQKQDIYSVKPFCLNVFVRNILVNKRIYAFALSAVGIPAPKRVFA